jgi:hypothetical protein
MNSFDDSKKMVRRNKLLGMWAAEKKLCITGQDAEAYSNALAVGTLDPERSDVLSKIRKDSDAAGVVQSDELIIHVMDDLMLQAGNLMTAQRLKKIANTLPALTRNAKRRDTMSYAKAIDDWESDLALLRDKYYLDFFHFGWPATHVLQ